MSRWIFIFSIAMIATINEAEGYCYTPWGSLGRCVNIKKCDPLLNLLKPRPVLPTVLRVLRKAQCGFEGMDPKVCCKNEEDDSEEITTTTTQKITFASNDMEQETTTTTTPMMPMMMTEPPPLVPIYQHSNRRLLDEQGCGPIPESRIFGGNITSIYEFPWMALLGYDVGTGSVEFRCGGSLISKRYVLTAAHCITELPEDEKLTNVRLGEHDLSHERDCDYWEDGVGYNCAPKYQEYGIERVHVYPNFTRRKLHNDIALIRLAGTADLGPPSVRPICLPLGDAALVKSRRLVVTGWGTTEFGNRSQRLLKVTLPIVDTEKCNLAYKHQISKIWHKQICAGGIRERDSCSGDSGGPLQAAAPWDRRGSRYVVYGIVSFGPYSCGVEGSPGVYTNVAYYVGWILDTMTY